MKSTMNKTTLCLVIVVIVTAITFLDNYVVYAESSVEVKAPKGIVVKQSGKKALGLRWLKVKGASGYEIHKARISFGGYKLVKKLKRTSWIDKTVSPGRRGTYKVRAYSVKKGKRVYGDFSYTVSAKVCTKKDKKRNVTRVIINHHKNYEGAFNLGCGESINKRIEKFNASVFGPNKKGSRNKWDPINERVRWYSTNPSMVKIRTGTDIRAGKKTGKCHIFAIAHNGIKSNMIPVYVKNYAYKKVKIENSSDRIQILFKECEDEIRALCSYYSQHHVKEKYVLRAFYGDDLREIGTLSDKAKWDLMKELLKKSPFREVSIIIAPNNIRFEVPNEMFTEALVFLYNKKVNPYSGMDRELSPHWVYMVYGFKI